MILRFVSLALMMLASSFSVYSFEPMAGIFFWSFEPMVGIFFWVVELIEGFLHSRAEGPPDFRNELVDAVRGVARGGDVEHGMGKVTGARREIPEELSLSELSESLSVRDSELLEELILHFSGLN